MTIERISSYANASPEGDLALPNFDKGSRSINALYTKYRDGRVYAEQRRGFNIHIANPDGGNGRAIHYNQVTNSGLGGWYSIINQDAYLVNSTGLAVGSSLGALNTAVVDDRGAWIINSGDFVVFNSPNQSSDTNDSEVSYIQLSVSETALNVMSDATFTGSVQPIVGGGVSMDGFMFFLNEKGELWNSDINDSSSWTGVNFLEASRESDSGIFLAKHHDNLVAFGGQTIEFFTNVGNASASPLQRRGDIFYTIGAKDPFCVTVVGDIIFFVGRSEQDNQLGVYVLENFRVRKISTDAIETHIGDSVSQSGSVKLQTSASNMLGHQLFHLIMRNTAVLDIEYIYDISTDTWGTFETDMFGDTQPVGLVGISGSGLVPAVRFEDRVVGLLYSGDFVNFERANTTTDFNTTGSVTANIEMTLTLPEIDMDTNTKKFCHRLNLIGSVDAGASSDVAASISWSDDHYNTFSTARTIASIRDYSKLTRLGEFRRRAFRILVNSDERVRIEALEVDTRKSLYA